MYPGAGREAGQLDAPEKTAICIIPSPKPIRSRGVVLVTNVIEAVTVPVTPPSTKRRISRRQGFVARLISPIVIALANIARNTIGLRP